MSGHGTGKVIILNEPPTGKIKPSTFRIETRPIPSADELKDGQVLIKVKAFSNEPVQRVWIDGAQDPVRIPLRPSTTSPPSRCSLSRVTVLAAKRVPPARGERRGGQIYPHGRSRRLEIYKVRRGVGSDGYGRLVGVWRGRRRKCHRRGCVSPARSRLAKLHYLLMRLDQSDQRTKRVAPVESVRRDRNVSIRRRVRGLQVATGACGGGVGCSGVRISLTQRAGQLRWYTGLSALCLCR